MLLRQQKTMEIINKQLLRHSIRRKSKNQVKTCSQSSCTSNDNSITKETGLVSTHRYRRTGRPSSFQHRFHGLAFSHHETLVVRHSYFFVSKFRISTISSIVKSVQSEIVSLSLPLKIAFFAISISLSFLTRYSASDFKVKISLAL